MAELLFDMLNAIRNDPVKAETFFKEIFPFKVYAAFMNQDGGATAPTATVLYNSFSALPSWSRLGIGDYKGTLANEFVVGKTMSLVTSSRSDGVVIHLNSYADTTGVFVACLNAGGTAAAESKDFLILILQKRVQ